MAEVPEHRNLFRVHLGRAGNLYERAGTGTLASVQLRTWRWPPLCGFGNRAITLNLYKSGRPVGSQVSPGNPQR